MEALQGRDGDKDDNSLLAVANFDLIKIPKSACELHDRLMPWTASRPAPQKSIVLWPDGASLKERLYICFFLFLLREGCQTTQFCRIGNSYNINPSLRGRERAQSYVEAIRRELWEQDVEEMFGLAFVLFHSSHSHLTGRDDLQRSQGNLEVGSVALEIEQSLSNVLLKLGGVLPRGAVGGDLVDGAHLGCGCSTVGWDELIVIVADRKIEGPGMVNFGALGKWVR